MKVTVELSELDIFRAVSNSCDSTEEFHALLQALMSTPEITLNIDGNDKTVKAYLAHALCKQEFEKSFERK